MSVSSTVPWGVHSCLQQRYDYNTGLKSVTELAAHFAVCFYNTTYALHHTLDKCQQLFVQLY